MATIKKRYHILGEADEFTATMSQLDAASPQQASAPIETVDTLEDPWHIPPDVWAAACIAPEGGASVLKAYREVAKSREHYKAQLQSIQASRQTKLESLTGSFSLGLTKTPSFTGTLLPPINGTQKTFVQAIAAGAQPRRLELHERAEREWAIISAALAAKLGRPEYELTMMRGPEFRRRLEAQATILLATPLNERIGGEEMWKMSLRDACERIVPVGGPFSGLFSTVREPGGGSKESLKNKGGERIGRPLDRLEVVPPLPSPPIFDTFKPRTETIIGLEASFQGPSSIPPGTGRSGGGGERQWSPRSSVKSAPKTPTMRGRDWQHSERLKSQALAYSSRLKTLYPHNPDLNLLSLHGTSLENQLSDLAYAPVRLQEVSYRMCIAIPLIA